MIAAKGTIARQTLGAFLAAHTMGLSPGQQGDIATYILSLRGGH